MTEHLNYLRTEDSMLKSPDNCNLFTPAQSGWFYVEGDFPLTAFRNHSGDYVPMCCMANVTSWSSNMAPEHFMYMNLWWHYSQDRSWSEYWEWKDGGQQKFNELYTWKFNPIGTTAYGDRKQAYYSAISFTGEATAHSANKSASTINVSAYYKNLGTNTTGSIDVPAQSFTSNKAVRFTGALGDGISAVCDDVYSYPMFRIGVTSGAWTAAKFSASGYLLY